MISLKTILVPINGRPEDDRPLSFAYAIAERFGAEVHTLRVLPARDRRAPRHESPMPASLPHDCASVAHEVRSDSVPKAIVQHATEHDVDLIVMGGRGKMGLHRRHLGGVAGPVVRYAPCSVLTVRDRLPERGVARILVPTDLSEASRLSLAAARVIASELGAELDVLIVDEAYLDASTLGLLPSLQMEQPFVEDWEARLKVFWADVPGPDVPHTLHVRTGAPAPEIINAALQFDSDLIVVGTHGRTGLPRLVLGSVAEEVVYRALCATLTIKSFGRPLVETAAVAEDAAEPASP